MIHDPREAEILGITSHILVGGVLGFKSRKWAQPLSCFFGPSMLRQDGSLVFRLHAGHKPHRPVIGKPSQASLYLIFLLHVRLDEVSLIFTGGHITSILVEGIRRKILVPGALQCCSPVLPRSPVFLRSLGTCCVYSKIDLTFCSPWGTLAPLLNWLEPKWKLQTNSHSVENSMCLNCSLKY